MDIRVGDRFKSKYGFGVWEFTHKSRADVQWGVCVEECVDFRVGFVTCWNFTLNSMWTYISNFAKSTNLTTLYDILCEK